MANEIKKADLAKVHDVDFVEMFEKGIQSLMTMLGITRKIEKKAGENLKVYKVTGTLSETQVGEGVEIPLSKYQTTYTAIGEVTLKKWRKLTTAEAIAEKGFNQAVNDTTDKMRKQIQAGIKTQLIGFFAGEGTTAVSGTGMQSCIANCWGKLAVLWEDTTIDAAYLVNPLDVATYLGGAQITTQTAFGMTYIENFLGMGTVILDSTVPQGKIYATAKENIVLYHIPMASGDMAEAFELTVDETGLIGVHTDPTYSNATVETVAYSGVGLFAENLGGIVVGTIAAA